MLHAVIVDDENMICQLILRLVDWEAQGVDVVGIAHNGQDALALAQEKDPDLIITDIRIPVFDGLELISRVQQAGLHARFIVVSGYRHFEYAHSALRYGVTDYLLKPINADELNHALGKLAADILRERSETASRAELTHQVHENDAKMRRRLLLALAEHRLLASEFNISLLNRDYGYALREAPVDLFIIKASCHRMEDYDLMPLVFTRVEPIVQSVLQPYCSTFEIAVVESRLYCLYQFAEGAERAREAAHQMIADQFSDVLNSFESFSLMLCCAAEEAASPAELPQLLTSVEHAVHYRLTRVRNYVSQYGSRVTDRIINPDALFSQGQQSVFCTYLSSGDQAKVREALRRIFSPFCEEFSTVHYDPEVLFSLTDRILSLTRSTLGVGVDAPDLTAAAREIDHAGSPHSLIDRFMAAYLAALEPHFSRLAAKTGAPIQKAIRIIETRYADPLTLDSVAAEAELSPAYLSTLFKKETGSTFSEFLTLCRMNEAKRLLRQTGESVASIAEQTGYMDAKYFSKVFSKTFGISPQKYRSL